MITVPLELSSLFSQQALLYYWASGQRTVILKSTVPCLILGYIPYVGSSNTYTKNYNNPQRKLLFKQFFGRLLILHTVM